GPQAPSVRELQDLGVARVSYGSAFLKAAIGGTRKLAQEILEKGTIEVLKEGMQTPEIAALVAKRNAGEFVPSQAIVVSIHTATVGAGPMRAVPNAQVIVGRGLEGDRYYSKLGTYSNQPGSGRDVTLIEIEAIEGLKRDYQIQLDPAQSRRN